MNDLYTPSEEITEFVLIGKKINNHKRLCLHPVVNEKVGAEVPFTTESAKQIFALFSEYKYEQKVFENLIPKEIIYAKDSPEKGLELKWIVKKSKREIYYSKDNNEKGLESKAYNLPTLLFKYSKKKLYVFALSDIDVDNINQDTLLYHAPLFNISNNGAVCMGNVNLSKVEKFRTFDKCKEFLERLFFNSYFTHSNNEKLINTAYLLKIKEDVFFNSHNLIKTNLNLNNIL